MKLFAFAPLSAALLLCLNLNSEAPANEEAIRLNNEGVAALNREEWHVAIEKLEASLKADPDRPLGRVNLAIAHSNYGLYLKKKDKIAALKEFHRAQYLNGTDLVVNSNVRGTIKLLGKNPDSFVDRMNLGDDARKGGDLVGAVVEYLAALKLKKDHRIHKKLGDVYKLLNEKDKAVSEYASAYKDEN
jgi:tetratricopeptide (TPR) repeat protein